MILNTMCCTADMDITHAEIVLSPEKIARIKQLAQAALDLKVLSITEFDYMPQWLSGDPEDTPDSKDSEYESHLVRVDIPEMVVYASGDVHWQCCEKYDDNSNVIVTDSLRIADL